MTNPLAGEKDLADFDVWEPEDFTPDVVEVAPNPSDVRDCDKEADA